MKICERRRATLRRVADLLVRMRDAIESSALAARSPPRDLMRLSDEAKTLGEEALLAAMPEGRVVYLDDEIGQVELERGKITIRMPNETPDEVADALFKMAKLVCDESMRYTIDGLVLALSEFTHRPDPQHDATMAKLDAIQREIAGKGS